MILNQYLGEWDTTFTANENPKEMKGRISTKWILGGRFLQQTATIQTKHGSQPFILSNLVTYDPDKEGFRAWKFTSAGTVSETRLTWDSDSKTMTSKTVDSPDEKSVTSTGTLVEDGEDHWVSVVEDQAGNTLSIVSGKNIRRENE